MYQQILGADYTVITDNQAVLRARTDRPGTHGDTLGGPLIEGALEGQQTAGYVNKADISTPINGWQTMNLGIMYSGDYAFTSTPAATQIT